MKGRPLIPFAVIAIIGLLLITVLSFVGLNQREAMQEDAEGNGGEEVTEFVDPVAAGEEMAQQSCIGCHGGDLTGAGGPDLTNLDLSEEEIVHIILNGTDSGAMPAMPLDEIEADAIAQYLLSLNE